MSNLPAAATRIAAVAALISALGPFSLGAGGARPAAAQTPGCADPDTSQIRAYWGQDALSDLILQIQTLRYTNSYRVLRLLSIRVIEQNLGAGSAWVHTEEHWIAETWSYDGYRYDSSDAWYDNQYYL